MEEILTTQMKEAIAAVGELVRADPRCLAIRETIEEYERSEELNALIAEYNVQQNALADAFGKDGEVDESVRTAVQGRIDALYESITTHPVYVAYLEAKREFDRLTTEIYAELQYAVTGQRPCSHDCSSCGGSCSHSH